MTPSADWLGYDLAMMCVGLMSLYALYNAAFDKRTRFPLRSSLTKVGTQLVITAVNFGIGWWFAFTTSFLTVIGWTLLATLRRP